MKTDNFIWIEGVAYSPNHPIAKAWCGKPYDWGFKGKSVMSEETKERFIKQLIKPTLNKTEARYFTILKERFPLGHVQAHTIKLQLAEKCWYLPDFSYTLPSGALVFVETKGGFERDDAIVKLKTAARQFPQFTFIKAKYVKGKWTETVMPK